MAGFHAGRVNVPEAAERLPGDACACFLCGQVFKGMATFVAHRYVDGIYVRVGGCQQFTHSKPNTSRSWKVNSHVH